MRQVGTVCPLVGTCPDIVGKPRVSQRENRKVSPFVMLARLLLAAVCSGLIG
jgi:hypothetical protein